MGLKCVFFLSQEEKARVPLDLLATNKKAPILMHLEYFVRLPDHDWVVAEWHKLIPSVYAACVIKEFSVSYSGPTGIFIRGKKNKSSIAATHAADFEFLNAQQSYVMCMTENGVVKSTEIITADGGPNGNWHFQNNSCSIQGICGNNSDTIFVAYIAAGHSAYNAIERHVTLHNFSGLILPFHHYCTHLDGNGKTTDSELEKRYCQKAGKVLA